ncbi:collagenase-like isoform X1 [Drosophila sulfurigaster albostrigata]|uniref:collagenase-like isoform X1 n=1 Tax=Drosophila sulfurigaster albostrigata TaxID=89887 RepID=UPI002D21A078|nr:collagenase-like isoform X1 [Drosophila sulfurigaster albostrigata]
MAKQYNWLLISLATLLLLVNIEAEESEEKLAIPTQFPFQVFIDVALKSDNSKWVPKCSGTIISKSAIVTTASCLDTEFDLAQIYFGAVNISNAFEIGQTRIKVERKYFEVHEEYNPVTLSNNIAIIKLPFELEFNEYVQAVSLPSKSDLSHYVGQEMIIAGWHQIDNQRKFAVWKVLKYLGKKVGEQLGKEAAKWVSSKIVGLLADEGSPITIHENDANIAVGMYTTQNGKAKAKLSHFVNLIKLLPWIKKIVSDIRLK